MKKIIITGANGFIGRHCIDVLKKRDFEIHALSSNEKENAESIFWHTVNLLNEEEVNDIFEKIKPEYLLHLAWKIDKNYNDNFHFDWINVGVNMLKVFHKHGGKRFVGAGTCFEYDWSAGICHETQQPSNSKFNYGFAKYTLNTILHKYCRSNNISYAWGRIFFAYGPGGNTTSLIPYVTKNLTEGKEVEITGGEQIRDYIFVEDIANAFVNLVDSEIQGAVNISSGLPTKVKEIVKIIADYFNKKNLVKFKSNNKLNFSDSFLLGDNTRLTQELKFTPEIGIREGVHRTIESLS